MKLPNRLSITVPLVALLAAGTIGILAPGGSRSVAQADDERGERDGDREKGDRDQPRDGDRPQMNAEVREKLEDLKRRHRELTEAGKHEEAQQIGRQARELMQRHGPRPGDGFRDGQPRPHDQQLIEALNALREEVARLRHDINELKGIHGDRPRFDGRRREGDRPRREVERGDLERGERDRPREREGRDRPE